MAQDTPAPPEAEVIKLARTAARMTPAQAAEKVRAAGGKISDTYWRDIERGHGGRRGKRVTTRASEGVLAQMAYVVGVTPEQLIGTGRRDAATVLAEILRRERTPAPADPPRPQPNPPEAPPDSAPPPQDIIEFALESGVNPDDPDDPHLRPVREEIAAATVRHGVAAPGRLVFQGRPWSADEAKTWDNPLIGWRSKELLIAITRARRDHDEAGWRNRSGRAGLTLAILARR